MPGWNRAPNGNLELCFIRPRHEEMTTVVLSSAATTFGSWAKHGTTVSSIWYGPMGLLFSDTARMIRELCKNESMPQPLTMAEANMCQPPRWRELSAGMDGNGLRDSVLSENVASLGLLRPRF